MRNFVAGSALVCLSVLLTGCSSGPLVIVPPDWRYEKDAINLNIKADKHLNVYQKTSHALLLCVYHLRDTNAFNQYLNERDGLTKLLECGRFDPSVVLARQMIIQPGQELTQVMDRAEGTRFVNIAAGYYNLRTDQVTRSYPVPLDEVKRGGNLIQTTKKLTIDLRLGPAAIDGTPEIQEAGKKR
ncbi:type VI secretion system lipoprotein TssJ [Pelotalea chapellei]|uniref:Type VI secretion system lipoprotein TssJ n=1 Tax=Pelotalea chapellei TaxID=44671 RepID=A0ABS5UAY0_9BACT|nr:type VI secretion system lipoprotein TssJ [Pelotalea chapellei]MBT1072788.1 type VI secretion system lipoprotein TssJ [Pelotalea chapellei]